MYPHRPVPGRAFDAQTILADRLDVLAPGIACPHFVACRGEQSGVHRPHRTGADDGDFHLIDGCSREMNDEPERNRIRKKPLTAPRIFSPGPRVPRLESPHSS